MAFRWIFVNIIVNALMAVKSFELLPFCVMIINIIYLSTTNTQTLNQGFLQVHEQQMNKKAVLLYLYLGMWAVLVLLGYSMGAFRDGLRGPSPSLVL